MFYPPKTESTKSGIPRRKVPSDLGLMIDPLSVEFFNNNSSFTKKDQGDERWMGGGGGTRAVSPNIV